MEPMKPMAPMRPLDFGPAWWPAELGQPTSSGGQDGRQYAFFKDKKRLAVREGDTVSVYDSGDHVITGAGQAGGSGLTLDSDGGELGLDTLEKLS